MTAAIAEAGAAAGEGAAAAGTGEGAAAAAPKSAPSSSSGTSSSTSASKTKSTTKGKSTSKNKGAILPSSGRGKGRGGAGIRLGGGARKALLAEFLVCAVIIALSPLTDRHRSEGRAALMKRNTALAALFLILALVSTAGRGASRAAAAFGGLVTVALLISDRDVLTKVADRFGAPAATGPAGPGGSGGAPPPGAPAGPPTAGEGSAEGDAEHAAANPPETGFGLPAEPGGQSWWDQLVSGLGPL